MTKTIDFWKKYKEDKKIQKLKKDADNKILKAKNLMQNKMKEKIEKLKSQTEEKYERKIKRLEKNKLLRAEKKARKLLGKKQTIKSENSTESFKYLKAQAFYRFQMRSKLLRTDENWYVVCLDNWEKRFWIGDWVDGGHIYSKHNYPQLAFDILNCRPITKRANKKQGDTIGTRFPKMKETLEPIAKDESLKNIKKDRQYYKQKLEELKDKCIHHPLYIKYYTNKLH